MKNGKRPSLSQKKMMKSHGLDPQNWLVVKDIQEYMEVVSRNELKRIRNKKIRTRKLYKQVVA